MTPIPKNMTSIPKNMTSIPKNMTSVPKTVFQGDILTFNRCSFPLFFDTLPGRFYIVHGKPGGRCGKY